MNLKIKNILLQISLLAAMGLGAEVNAQTFNAADDFSAVNNPNGPWQYGGMVTSASVFTLGNAVTISSLDSWQSAGSSGVTFNPDSAEFVSGSLVVPPETLTMHPGSDGELSVLRFVVPDWGDVTVSGSFLGADSFPTTTDVHVLVNGVSLFDSYLNLFGEGNQADFLLNALPLAKNDVVDFVVGYGNGSYNYDTAILNATVMFSAVPEPAISGLAFLTLGAVFLQRGRSRKLAA